MTTQRTDILAGIATALRAIQAAGTLPSAPVFGAVLFKRSVKIVETVPRGWTPSVVTPDTTPLIGIQSCLTRHEHLPGGQIWCFWQLLLSVWADDPDPEARLTLMDDLEDDIIAALSADTTLGARCTRVAFVETDRDDLSTDPQTAMRVLVEVKYYRSVSSS